MKTKTDQWVRLISPQITGRPQIGTWHRHDGEQTLCGFMLFDRAIHDDPPPGAKTCRFCAMAVGG